MQTLSRGTLGIGTSAHPPEARAASARSRCGLFSWRKASARSRV